MDGREELRGQQQVFMSSMEIVKIRYVHAILDDALSELDMESIKSIAVYYLFMSVISFPLPPVKRTVSDAAQVN